MRTGCGLTPVEAAVLNSLGNVVFIYIFASLKVGDGTADLQYPVIGPCVKTQPV